jgi:hypothetical protein
VRRVCGYCRGEPQPDENPTTPSLQNQHNLGHPRALPLFLRTMLVRPNLAHHAKIFIGCMGQINYKTPAPLIIGTKACYLILIAKYAIPLKRGQNFNIRVVIFIILVLIPW